MSNVSNGTPCASDSASGAALLVLEAIATNSSVAFANLLEVFAAGSWPISKAALLFAAVKLGRSTIAEQLLARGAPASFVVAKLPAADHVSVTNASPALCAALNVAEMRRLGSALCLLPCVCLPGMQPWRRQRRHA